MQSLSWHPWVLPSPHPPFPTVPCCSVTAAPASGGWTHGSWNWGWCRGWSRRCRSRPPEPAGVSVPRGQRVPSLPPHYGSRLSTFIQRCCGAAETRPQAAALLISWEANERSHRGTCLYSHRAWQPQRSRSPTPQACWESPRPVQPLVWWLKHGPMPRRQGTHVLPTHRETVGAMGTTPHKHLIQGFHHVPPQHSWKKHLEMLDSMVP